MYNKKMSNEMKNAAAAKAISAALAALAMVSAVPFVSAVPVHAAEQGEFENEQDERRVGDHEDENEQGERCIGDHEDDDIDYDLEHEIFVADCDDDAEDGYAHGYVNDDADDDDYDGYGYIDENALNDLYGKKEETVVVFVQEDAPCIYNSNYYPGTYVQNLASYPVTLCFRGYNGNTNVYTLAGYSSFLVQSDYGSGIATKDFWICRGEETKSTYTFVANTPNVPAQQKQEVKKEEKKEEKKEQHVCNMEWVVVKEPTKKSDGLEQYRCKSCGRVEMQVAINAASTYIKELYTAIDKAPANGTVVYNAEDYHTISKYVLQKMAQRNDVTVSIQFTYKNVPYTVVFPAKTDYTKLLQGKDQFFGFLGLNGYNGIAVAKR